MAMMLELLKLGEPNRNIYLYDTFSGMSAPTDVDQTWDGEPAQVEFSQERLEDGTSTWARASLEEVMDAISGTGYPMSKVHFVKGMVEKTIPGVVPESLALLRLDTDWYRSTKHELQHLYPLIRHHGVLIVDDYGYWKGSRQAVDEYFKDHHLSPLLNPIDQSARIIVKTS